MHLNVFYKPTCRIRNEQTIDGGLNLRCDVDAFPPNVTYVWTHNQQPLYDTNGPTLMYRDANSLLRKAKEGDLDAVNAIFGTFACQASNNDTTQVCNIKSRGMVSFAPDKNIRRGIVHIHTGLTP